MPFLSHLSVCSQFVSDPPSHLVMDPIGFFTVVFSSPAKCHWCAQHKKSVTVKTILFATDLFGQWELCFFRKILRKQFWLNTVKSRQSEWCESSRLSYLEMTDEFGLDGARRVQYGKCFQNPNRQVFGAVKSIQKG